MGGDVALEGGSLWAEVGRIELGSVAGNSRVRLRSSSKGYVLDYEGVENFQDIQVSQQALVSTSGEGGGDIQVQGRRVNLTESSIIAADNLGRGEKGDLKVNASESVELFGSALFAQTRGIGEGGELTINTKQLRLKDGAQTSSWSENGSNIILSVDDLLVLLNNSQISTSAGTPQAGGNGGNINIDTGLIVAISQENSDITANAFNGQGGNITWECPWFEI